MQEFDIVFLQYKVSAISGYFYDTFEYYYITKQKYKRTALICVTDDDIQNIKQAICYKYDVDQDSLNDIYNIPYSNLKRRILQIRCKLLIISSAIHLADLLMDNRYVVANKYITFRTVPDYISNANYELKIDLKNIVVLEDPRLYKTTLKNCEVISYKRRILFNVMRTFKNIRNRCLLSLTNHDREYDIEYINKLSTDKNILILTDEERYHKYKLLETPTIKIKKIPINRFLSEFDKTIYLPSIRGFDCSPRLIAECHYFNKHVEVVDMDRISTFKDGGYYRIMDIQNNFDSLVLDTEDEFLKILDNYL